MGDVLFELQATHCFFGCGHVERGVDPQATHASMEAHYESRHRLEIDRAVGYLRGRRPLEVTS